MPPFPTRQSVEPSAACAATSSHAACPEGARCGLRGLLVLDVGNDTETAARVDEILWSAGCLVVRAYADDRGLDAVLHGLPMHVLLTSLELLRRDGGGFVRALREANPGLPVVATVGGGAWGAASALRSLGEGFLALLERPLRPDRLLSAVALAACRTRGCRGGGGLCLLASGHAPP